MELRYSRDFLGSAHQLPAQQAQKLSKLLELLQESPFHPKLHTKKLSGSFSGLYSFRITRDWRVIFQFNSPSEIQLVDRTHLENIPDRDMSQFSREQGATTMAYPLRYVKEERSSYSRKLAISRRVARVCSYRCVASSSQCIKHSFLLAPCAPSKPSATRSGNIFEIGSSHRKDIYR